MFDYYNNIIDKADDEINFKTKNIINEDNEFDFKNFIYKYENYNNLIVDLDLELNNNKSRNKLPYLPFDKEELERNHLRNLLFYLKQLEREIRRAALDKLPVRLQILYYVNGCLSTTIKQYEEYYDLNANNQWFGLINPNSISKETLHELQILIDYLEIESMENE